MEQKLIMSIDPSGTGTTGICWINRTEEIEKITFGQYQSKNWEEHFDFIFKEVKEKKPSIILFENTSYIHKRIPGTLNLLKLIGAITILKFAFNDIENVDHIAVNQVKGLKKKIHAGEKSLEFLTCEVGRGKGWKYNGERVNLHQLDALIIFSIWKEKGEGLVKIKPKKTIKKKIIVEKISKTENEN
jgi:hypothetical protein